MVLRLCSSTKQENSKNIIENCFRILLYGINYISPCHILRFLHWIPLNWVWKSGGNGSRKSLWKAFQQFSRLQQGKGTTPACNSLKKVKVDCVCFKVVLKTPMSWGFQNVTGNLEGLRSNFWAVQIPAFSHEDHGSLINNWSKRTV